LLPAMTVSLILTVLRWCEQQGHSTHCSHLFFRSNACPKKKHVRQQGQK
jgi:hypothetical protein